MARCWWLMPVLGGQRQRGWCQGNSRVVVVNGRATGAGGWAERVTVSDPISLFMMAAWFCWIASKHSFNSINTSGTCANFKRKGYWLKAKDCTYVHSTLVHVCRTCPIVSECMFFFTVEKLPGSLSFWIGYPSSILSLWRGVTKVAFVVAAMVCLCTLM